MSFKPRNFNWRHGCTALRRSWCSRSRSAHGISRASSTPSTFSGIGAPVRAPIHVLGLSIH